MTPTEIKRRRLELGLTIDEMAFALNVTEAELTAVESGESDLHKGARFREAFEILEERVFGTYVGA
jgi:DNA-binding transcriptional regulator YiaG